MTNNLEENNIKNILIDLELIYEKENVLNRKPEENLSSELSKLQKSIKETGLIHPITVREDNEGEYELFVGHRRFEVYRILVNQNLEKYKSIPAFVYPRTTSTKSMLKKKMHENDFRKNLKPSEKTESILSLIPIFLELENAESNLGAKNANLGYEILKKFNSYIRNKTTREKYEKSLQKLTGSDSVISDLIDFFDNMGIKPKSFLLSARVYTSCKNNIILLYSKGKITNRHALALESMTSEEDKEETILQLENNEISGYKSLEKRIRESNAKYSPIKSNNRLIQACDHVLIQLRGKKGNIDEQKSDEIKMYLEKIENILTDLNL